MKVDMCVYLCTKFQISSIILKSFRQAVVKSKHLSSHRSELIDNGIAFICHGSRQQVFLIDGCDKLLCLNPIMPSVHKMIKYRMEI